MTPPEQVWRGWLSMTWSILPCFFSVYVQYGFFSLSYPQLPMLYMPRAPASGRLTCRTSPLSWAASAFASSSTSCWWLAFLTPRRPTLMKLMAALLGPSKEWEWCWNGALKRTKAHITGCVGELSVFFDQELRNVSTIAPSFWSQAPLPVRVNYFRRVDRQQLGGLRPS